MSDDRKILQGTREHARGRIEDQFCELRDAVISQIQKFEEEGFNEIRYELPTVFRDTGGLPIARFQVILYGKIIEHLKATDDDFQVSFEQSGERYFLLIKWKPLLDLSEFERCKQILTAHTLAKE